MNDRAQIFRSLRLILISGAVMSALLGCQPTTEETSTANATEPAADNVSDHNMHDEESSDHDMTDEHASDDHSGHDHASKSTPFTCEPEATIGVYYHSDSMPATAYLLIDGIEYDLTATTDSDMNADTQTYTSDIGLDNTNGIIWQVSGDRALLRNKTLDNDVAVENETVLFDCQRVID